jgi:uncharacterized repeat protein (TIGR03803 family)
MKTLAFSQKTFAVVLFCLATMIGASAQTLTTLVSFNKTDGYLPTSLVQGTDGNFYGVSSGGDFSGCENQTRLGCGTIFRVTPEGALTTIYNFCSLTNCADGSAPIGNLVQGSNGNFYGVTKEGGNLTVECGFGCGTIFEITTAGKLTTLYRLCSQTNCADGEDLLGGITLASNGTFYGTTARGGAYGDGEVFAITAGGKFTVPYSFCVQANCTDGSFPAAALLQASNGKLYGSTDFGGANNRGTIFSISTAGALVTLHSFYQGESANPGQIIQGADGSLYGLTAAAGSHLQGTVYKLTTSGTLDDLHSFCLQLGCPDGADPQALLVGSDGNFYGTAYGGPGGEVFELTPTGIFSIPYSFCELTGCHDGAGPEGLTQATNGNFYGVTTGGGAHNDGTVYVLSTGLEPFVEAQPAFSTAGRVIRILGNNLTGTTSVTFNGTAATFSVASDTYITATVPSGATTGTIEVTTPTGTLSSNVPFRIVP